MRNTLNRAEQVTVRLAVPATALGNHFLLHGDITVDRGPALLEKWLQGGQPATGFVTVSNTTLLRITDPTNAVLGGLLFAPGEEHTLQVQMQLYPGDPTPAGVVFNWDILQLAPLTTNAEPTAVGGERYSFTVPDRRVGISVSPSGLVLAWCCGAVLQQADQVSGPWTDVPGATSPFNVIPTAPSKFYRVRW